MHADAIVYHNYFKSPNLALHRILPIHSLVEHCRSTFARGSVASLCLAGSEGVSSSLGPGRGTSPTPGSLQEAHCVCVQPRAFQRAAGGACPGSLRAR